MKLFKVFTAIGSLALLALVFTPGLKAENDVWNKKINPDVQSAIRNPEWAGIASGHLCIQTPGFSV